MSARCLLEPRFATQALLLGTLFAVLVANPNRVHAGEPARFVQIMVDPLDPDHLSARYTPSGGGLVQSSDGGATWALSCADVIKGERFTDIFHHSGGGPFFFASFDSLWEGDESGCGWHTVPDLEGQRVIEFATDPADASISYAVTATGGEGRENGVFQRAGSGEWEPLGTHVTAGPDGLPLPISVRVATREDARRIYALVLASSNPTGSGNLTMNYLLRVSDDDGMTWAENTLALKGQTVRIAAVDALDPDRVALVVSEVGRSSLLVSKDAGASFEPYTELTDFAGITGSSDGRIWIADAGSSSDLSLPKGVWTAARLGDELTSLAADYPLDCITYGEAKGTLYGCKRPSPTNGPSLGTIDLEAGTFTPMLDLSHQGRFASCEGVDMAALCEAQMCSVLCDWNHYPASPLCTSYLSPTCGPNSIATAPGGTGGAGAAAAPVPKGPEPKAKESSGCSVAPAASQAPGTAAWFLLSLLGAAMRRRSRI